MFGFIDFTYVNIDFNDRILFAVLYIVVYLCIKQYGKRHTLKLEIMAKYKIVTLPTLEVVSLDEISKIVKNNAKSASSFFNVPESFYARVFNAQMISDRNTNMRLNECAGEEIELC